MSGNAININHCELCYLVSALKNKLQKLQYTSLAPFNLAEISDSSSGLAIKPDHRNVFFQIKYQAAVRHGPLRNLHTQQTRLIREQVQSINTPVMKKELSTRSWS